MTGIREPIALVVDDDARRRHQVWACWSDDDDAPAHAVFWRTSDGRIVLKGLVANARFRGRAMLRWIGRRYGLPIHVVEVIPSAVGFWNRMRQEGTIVGWEASDGYASPLERLAVAPGRTRRAA